MNEIRIIIAGSREFNDYELLRNSISSLIRNKDFSALGVEKVKIVSGTAKGADKLGEYFATEFHYEVERFPANWDLYGKSAGLIRNRQMAEYAVEGDNIGILVAFWNGTSKGTQSMIELADKYGLEVHIINWQQELTAQHTRRKVR